jgi:trimeric autotransporter adhesin
VLTGNGAANVLTGGAGNDVYFVGSGDSVVEVAGGGVDTVQTATSWTLGAEIENLVLTGAAAINGTGNAAANTITGNAAANMLDGGAGADTLIGGTGNDGYVVDSAADVVIEILNEGIDLVSSAVTYTLGVNVENLILTGAGAINGTGNALDNLLTGNSAANVLSGGAGNDTYVVSTGDSVVENPNEGTDTVQSNVTYALGTNVENLTLTGTAVINGTGNTLANQLTGNAASNVLDGSAGNDTMAGGAGNDTYVVDAAGDVVTENAGEGTDSVQSGITFALTANVETLTLTGASAINGTGNDLANTINGNGANNVLDGGAGNDTLAGGAGDDTYVVDSAGDVATETASAGTDLVLSSLNWTLSANLENLTLTGSANLTGTGNTLVNTLRGNAGANTLDGGAGNDTLIGGAGDDIYLVDSATDVVTEATNEGIDLVNSGVTFTLGINVENLTLTGSTAINGTGNALANVLTGNSAANVLTGGAGNDTYVVGSGDTTVEAAGGGIDTVQAQVTWTLGAEIENLTLTGSSAINGTGNALANLITGNGAVNTLDGGAGVDTMIGGAGNDIYTVDNTADVVTELTNEGTDLVNSGVTYTLAANVENLTLTGTSAINGAGNALANVLTGNSAANVLTGGAGDDTYVVGAGDTTIEAASGGTDTVQAGVTWTLAAEVENLTLTGTAAINGTGNALANVLIGNSAVNTLTGGDGNDTLDGGAGNDSLVGGLGNDTYVVDSVSDVITEAASAGTDTVQSSVTLTLTSTNLENLTLLGSTTINGTGNINANVLTGNAGNNTLAGLEGADTYIGGGGNDTLTDSSTSSNDIYRWGTGQGSDTVTDAGGTADRIELATGITSSQVKLTRSVNNLVVSITGSTDTLTVTNWYASAANKVEQIVLADGSVIALGTAAPLSVISPAAREVLQTQRTTSPLKGGYEPSPNTVKLPASVEDAMHQAPNTLKSPRAMTTVSHVDGDRHAQLLVQAMAQFDASNAAVDSSVPLRWRQEPARVTLATPI